MADAQRELFFAESKGEELVEYVFGLSKVNNSVDGLSNTIETPHAHIKCFNNAFAAYAADADNNGIYCGKPFYHPGVHTVLIKYLDCMLSIL